MTERNEGAFTSRPDADPNNIQRKRETVAAHVESQLANGMTPERYLAVLEQEAAGRWQREKEMPEDREELEVLLDVLAARYVRPHLSSRAEADAYRECVARIHEWTEEQLYRLLQRLKPAENPKDRLILVQLTDAISLLKRQVTLLHDAIDRGPFPAPEKPKKPSLSQIWEAVMTGKAGDIPYLTLFKEELMGGDLEAPIFIPRIANDGSDATSTHEDFAELIRQMKEIEITEEPALETDRASARPQETTLNVVHEVGETETKQDANADTPTVSTKEEPILETQAA
ncbi:hypothetical protein HY734_03715 [Candidatus Uhrbacteria bacterium]|nr:hypothetical protein [Candidatus Uhrbacteria bacterium]